MADAPKVAAWSYSRYALHAECPRRYKYKNIDKLPDPPGPAMERGDKVHKAAEAFLTTPGTPLPTELQHFNRLAHELRDLGPLVEQEWGFRRDWSPTGWFARDTWLRSKLDALVVYADDEAEAIDWKTGKRYASNDAQMELFALTVMCRFPKVKRVTTRLWYVDLPKDNEEIAEFDAADREKLREKWEKKALAVLEDTTFPARPNPKCRWCPYSKSAGGPCQFG